MKSLKKILIWACIITMLFGNVSLPGFAETDLPGEVPQEESVPAAEQEPEIIRVGDSMRVSPDTVLTLHADRDRTILLVAEAPVNVTVQGIGTFGHQEGKLEARLSVSPGDYRLTFSCDREDPFVFQVREAEEPAQEEVKQAEPESEEAQDTAAEPAVEEKAEEDKPDAETEEKEKPAEIISPPAKV